MQEFVICYAESIDNPDVDWIVFIDKDHPPWQHGHLNLPGGRMQAGENLFDVAVCKLKKETTLVAERGQCELLGTIHGVNWVVYTVLCPFRGPFSMGYGGREHPVVMSLHQALCKGSRILPELRTILPLCISRQPWQMILGEDRNCLNYVLKVNDV